MKKRILVILNGRFPFEKSEEFLSNELDYTKGFDEIICFPIFVYGDKSLDDIIYNKNKIDISFYNPISSYKTDGKIFKLLFLILTKKNLYKEVFYLYRSRRLSIKNIKKLFSFLLISNNSVSESWNKINEVVKNNNVVLYSYWMHCNALTAIYLRKKIDKIATVKKIVTRCHRFDLYEYADDGNYIPMRNYIFSNVDEIHSISDDGLIYLRNNYSINQNKLILSRLGTIDRGVSIFPKTETLHLVSCSWMRSVKRISAIVKAVSQLQLKLNWVHYGDGEEYNSIVNLIKEIKSPLITCKLKGAYSNEEVLDEYTKNQFDVFINVSENEGVPVSIMEAMSFGKIIIATDVGGTSEIVENGKNGFLLNKDFTNDDLVSAITNVALLDPKEFSIMCLHSRKIWEERCNAETNYKLFYNTMQVGI